MWVRHGMLQEGTISTRRTPGKPLAQGTDRANRIIKKNFWSFCQSYREKSCLSFAPCFPPLRTPRPATQAQAGGQQGPPGWRWSLQEDCDFGPARSSQPYLSFLSELQPNVSMGWKSHRAHISILKAVVGLWSCYLQVLRLWRCYSWHLCIEAAIKRHTHTPPFLYLLCTTAGRHRFFCTAGMYPSFFSQ